MDVYDAVTSRRAVRGFTDEPVSRVHSWPQMAWSQVRETVADVLSPPDRLVLFCGMSIGYEDPEVSDARTGRAPLDETVTFVDG